MVRRDPVPRGALDFGTGETFSLEMPGFDAFACARRNDNVCSRRTSAISRRDAPEGLHLVSPSGNQRAQGRPGARCTRGLMCNSVRSGAHEHTGSAESTPAFPAQWLYGLCRDLLGDEFFLVTVVDEYGLSKPGWARRTFTNLTSATDARTTRFCRTQPPVFAKRLAGLRRRSSACRRSLMNQ